MKTILTNRSAGIQVRSSATDVVCRRIVIVLITALFSSCSQVEDQTDAVLDKDSAQDRSLQSSTNGGPELPQRPNILWIVAEDLSPIIPPFGDYTVATPNLTRLADEGIRYSHVFSPSGVCAPSRAALATGMYQNHIGAMHMRTSSAPRSQGLLPYEALPPAQVKMHSEYFRRAGYYASNNAKEDYQFRKPVTAWDESSVDAHWRKRAPGQPFFSVFNIGVTHESQVWSRADTPWLVDENLDVPIPPYLPDTDVAVNDIRRVYSNIVLMDQRVGEIIAQLEEDNLLDETIIFWYADHGGPLPRQKRLLYDSGMRVPLIVRFPDKWRAGETDDQLISFIDFKSTILSLAGIEPPDYVDGRAFLGEFATTAERSYAHGAADRFDSRYNAVRAVRDKRYKYLRNLEPDTPYYLPVSYREQMAIMQELLRLRDAGELNEIQSQWFRPSRVPEELFDTEVDPHELNNLVDDPALQDKLTELSAELDRWMAAIEDQGLIPELDFVASIWPGLEQPVTAATQFNRQDNGLALQTETEGASIGYQILRPGEQLSDTWQVYMEPLSADAGATVVALAHRIGYKPSSQTRYHFD